MISSKNPRPSLGLFQRHGDDPLPDAEPAWTWTAWQTRLSRFQWPPSAPRDLNFTASRLRLRHLAQRHRRRIALPDCYRMNVTAQPTSIPVVRCIHSVHALHFQRDVVFQQLGDIRRERDSTNPQF